MNTQVKNSNRAGMLKKILKRNQDAVHAILPFDMTSLKPSIFDLSSNNQELGEIDTSNVEKYSRYIFNKIRQQGNRYGVGKYDEDRVVYKHSELFDHDKESRSVHLGIDIFVPPGTQINSPLPAKIHSFANNNTFGNYGPTIILKHILEGFTFYTLYGHLSLNSLSVLIDGQKFAAGDTIAWIGDSHENGKWPPHLHFQIIIDMGDWKGDFPGVASPSQRQKYLELCPDPNLILRIPGLND